MAVGRSPAMGSPAAAATGMIRTRWHAQRSTRRTKGDPAMAVGGLSAGATAAASYGGGAGEARSLGGVVRCKKCDGAVDLGGGRLEVKERRRCWSWHS
jgi:uncharacterized protein YodC (DUF2158 family)